MAFIECVGGGSGINVPLLDIKNHTYRFTCSAGTWVSSKKVRYITVYVDGAVVTSGTTDGQGDHGGTGNLYIRSDEADVLKGAYNIRFHIEGYWSGSTPYSKIMIYINEYKVYEISGIGAASAYDTGELTFE